MSLNADAFPALFTAREQVFPYKTFYRVALLISDALMLILAFAIAYWLRFETSLTLAPEIMPAPTFYGSIVLVLLPVWLFIFFMLRLYDFHFLLGGTAEYARVFNACSAGMMIVIVTTFLVPQFVIARGWLVTAWLASVVFVILSRFTLRRIAYALRTRGFFVTPAIIVGINEEAIAIGSQLQDSLSSGLKILGYVDQENDKNRHKNSDNFQSTQTILNLSEIPQMLETWGEKNLEVIVASTALTRSQLLNLIEILDRPNIDVRLSSGLFEILTTGMQVRAVGFVPLISLNKLRLDPIESFLKGLLDYSISISLLLLLLPLFLFISILIKIDSRGSILYRRRVLGVGGKPFNAFKFRTMFTNGDEILEKYPEKKLELNSTHKIKDDPRITKVGSWLRRYSLDELPQLLNVLLGQMSLVGPRMITDKEASQYGALKRNLLTVKPGITGLWQVSGRSDISYDERVRLDMHYIRTYTIWRDIQILFIETPPAVFRARGAY